MTLHRIQRTSTITVANHKTLVQVWRDYGPVAQELIGTVVCKKPLTDAQTRRLPTALRSKLRC